MRRLAFHGEVLATLTLASILIAVLPFRRVAQLVARRSAGHPVEAVTARRIDAALRRWARWVPWHAMCFQQGLAAVLMLRRRHRAATLHYGARHGEDDQLVAHVWVRSGAVDVAGCEGADRFALLASFPAP